MEDQYGSLPSELRHQLSSPSASSVFPALSHRNNPTNPTNTNNFHHPFLLSSNTAFPLVSGGGLVDHSHFSLYHHHNHHHDHQLESSGGVQLWNNNVVGNNISSNENIVVDGIIGGELSNNNNNSRWPRQETLTLLEIRSRLNSKFKDTNQKAPLWDEISRIMAEEHGYQRSGKKCKEKFENLYKYYKKTKEGKAGRQDGKHYRFFRQLESIYGDQTQSSSLLLDNQYVGSRNNTSSLLYDHQSNNSRPTNNIINHESLSFSVNSTEFETSSSENNNNNNNNEEDLSAIAFKMNHRDKMKGVMMSSTSRKSSAASTWKARVEGFVDSQMKKIMATQESWMEKMLKSVIDKEEDRLAKEDHRRRQEAARFDHEFSEFWAKERAWVESRDEALVEALRNLRGKQSSLSSTLELPSFPERIGRDNNRYNNTTTSYQRWSEEEISSLIELRAMFEYNNNNNNNMRDQSVWDEIASKMACLGFGRTANECREKWESVSLYVTMTSECKKKRREDYYKVVTPLQQQQQGYYYNFCDGSQQQQLELKQEESNSVMGLQLNDNNNPSSSSTNNVGTSSSQIHPSNNFFHLLFGEGENLWEKYGTLKLGKDKINQL